MIDDVSKALHPKSYPVKFNLVTTICCMMLGVNATESHHYSPYENGVPNMLYAPTWKLNKSIGFDPRNQLEKVLFLGYDVMRNIKEQILTTRSSIILELLSAHVTCLL